MGFVRLKMVKEISNNHIYQFQNFALEKTKLATYTWGKRKKKKRMRVGF